MTKIYAPLAAALALFSAAPSAHGFATLKHHSSVASVPTQHHHRQQQQRFSPPAPLFSSTTTGSEDPYASPQLDTDAILKYGVAGITELSLFAGLFKLLDVSLSQLDIVMPFPVAFVIFYACSLKSRVLNPLNNQRPDRAKAVEGEGSSGFRDRVMPSWTPPGVVFPIMWLLIIGPIRAYSSALIATNVGFFSIPILAFIGHLTVGDIWNTINNTEKRYGAAVIGVLCVVLSAANASYQYYNVDMFAGKLLGGTLLWLCTAAALITDTWRLNPVNEDGKLVPLYPVKGESETKFLWGAKED